MGVLKALKKRKVPDELPELVSDTIEEKPKSAEPIKTETKIEEKTQIKSEEIKPSAPVITTTEEIKKVESEKPQVKTEDKKEEKLKKAFEIIKESPEAQENGFFSEFEKYMNKEMVDLSHLENWYKNKFLPRDIVSDMRLYWEKQKNTSVIKLLGKNFQEKISEKTFRLQELEREWQRIYFDLIEKEDEIRESERELKKMLSELVELCKKREQEKPEKEIVKNLELKKEDNTQTIGEGENKIIKIM